MDSQFVVSREELYNVQMEIKHVQAVQLSHADRLLRIEKRQADDAALKSVWGSGSPFPGILSGTPQQGPVQNPANDVFDDFDDEQGQNLLGSLHLEADEEPVRRGASRANSVRFDVSALQGSSWTAGSRNSGEFGPMRPGSGIGSHPMTERSLSHKSDGRHSSAGHSIHSVSGRTNSLGLDTNFVIGGHNDDSALNTPDPPPGLFILGSVPSIIRCWLSTNFSHNALLYAAVCSGSQRSILDYTLVKELGLMEHLHRDSLGRQTIRLHVYLPEAIITQSISRTNSPHPQIPALSAEFEIIGLSPRSNPGSKKHIRVVLGCDTLRAHNADILLSQNLMTLYGEDGNKLSVPFVRPEDESAFRYLSTTNVLPEKTELKATAPAFTPTETKPKIEATTDAVSAALRNGISENRQTPPEQEREQQSTDRPQSSANSDVPLENQRASSLKSVSAIAHSGASASDKVVNQDDTITELDHSATTPVDTTRQESSSGIWGSWRQGNPATAGVETESISGYQRATRGAGRSMKVLKPSKSSATTPSASPASTGPQTRSISRTGAVYEPPPGLRLLGESRRKSQTDKQEGIPSRWESRKVDMEELKTPRSVGTVPRSSNPVGGASAFAWMNSGQSKTSTASAE